jgi:hypothetical protein
VKLMNVKIQALGERIHNALVDFTKQTGWFDADLAGMCAVGSHLLVSEAKRKYGLNVEFKVVYGHAWTEHKGIIYDVTATQFGHKGKVFCAPRTSLISVDNKRITEMYQRDQEPDNINWCNRSWPSHQKPQNYKIKWLNQYKAVVIYEDK